jgi:hypothetical protein
LVYELIKNSAKDDSSAIAKAASPLMKSPVRIAPTRCFKSTVHFVPDVGVILNIVPRFSDSQYPAVNVFVPAGSQGL